MFEEKQLWIDEPYEVESIWYPSFSARQENKKEYRHHGKLTYTPSKGAFLQLYHHDDVSLNWGDNKIYGGDDNSPWHDKVTCLGVSIYEYTSKSTIFFVDSVFKGFHLPDRGDGNILEFNFSIKHLNQWVKQTGFKFNRNSNKKSFTINYKGRNGKWLQLNDLFDFKISASAWLPHKVQDYGRIETREQVIFHLRGRNHIPHKYCEYINIMNPILDFFTLASLDCANPFNISATGDFGYIEGIQGEHIPASASVSLSQIAISNQWYESQKYNFLFCEEDLDCPLQHYLKKWLAKYHLLQTPFSLYKDAVYNNKNIDIKFLLLSQAIETYHRRFRNACYVSESDFQCNVLKPLCEAIPTKLGRDFKQSLINRLRYSNEYSLRKRIKSLVDENKDILKKFFKVTNGLEARITDTRNLLTHFATTEQKVTIDTLVFYFTILKALFELSLLREIDFEEEKTLKLVEKCEHFRSLKYRAPWELQYPRQ